MCRASLVFRMVTDRIEAFLAGQGHDAIRGEIGLAGVEAVIPAKVSRCNLAPHDRTRFKGRNLLEPLFNKLRKLAAHRSPLRKNQRILRQLSRGPLGQIGSSPCLR